MDHPLDDCYLNIRRAKQRFNALESEAIEWFKSNDHFIDMAFNSNTGEEIIKAEGVPALPADWGVTVKEIIDHLRSALDYLVYELALKGGGEPEKERTMFPIASSSGDYFRLRGKGKRRRSHRDICLAGVSEKWKAEIDKLQPYEPTGRRELPALLHLSNSGKHRTGLRVRTRIVTQRYAVVLESGEFLKGFEAYIKGFDEGQMKIEAVKPGRSRDFAVITEKYPSERIGASIAFGPNPPVTPFQLKQITLAVEEIVTIFKPAFAP